MGVRKKFRARIQTRERPISSLYVSPSIDTVRTEVDLGIEDRIDIQDSIEGLSQDLMTLEDNQSLYIRIAIDNGQVSVQTTGSKAYGVSVSLVSGSIQLTLNPSPLTTELGCLISTQVRSPRVNYYPEITDSYILIEGRTNLDTLVNHAVGVYQLQVEVKFYG